MSLFGTAGIRGDVQTTVTPTVALQVGDAVAREADETTPTVALGQDGRTTSPGLAAALTAGLESGGATVERLGTVPTPALAYASQGQRGVMITASHNPPTDNGIKLFVDGVEYDSAAEQRVATRYETGDQPLEWDQWGQARERSVLDSYRTAVVEYVRETVGTLDGLKVAVDCGNGMGSLATPQVIKDLGGEPVALNANVDGAFPARESKPTPESLEETRAFVADADVDCGIAHDGDADRVVIMDGDGTIVHEDTIVAVVAEHYVRSSTVEDPVVITTPNASGRIDERVRAAGGRVERTALGTLHEGIAAATGSVVFAAEPWKHIHTQFGGWIDGIASAALIAALIADAGGIQPLTAPVSERPYRKVSIACSEATKQPAMARLKTQLPAEYPDATVETEYGLRLEFSDGSWVLVRPSGTEPYLRVYAESNDLDARITPIRDTIEQTIQEVDETGSI